MRLFCLRISLRMNEEKGWRARCELCVSCKSTLSLASAGWVSCHQAAMWQDDNQWTAASVSIWIHTDSSQADKKRGTNVDVYDVGPTLIQHWFNVWCLLDQGGWAAARKAEMLCPPTTRPETSQQTEDNGTMVFIYWASFADDDPTLNQHCKTDTSTNTTHWTMLV